MMNHLLEDIHHPVEQPGPRKIMIEDNHNPKRDSRRLVASNIASKNSKSSSKSSKSGRHNSLIAEGSIPGFSSRMTRDSRKPASRLMEREFSLPRSGGSPSSLHTRGQDDWSKSTKPSRK